MELSAHARSRRRLKAQRNANIHFLFGMPDTLEAEPLELSRTEIASPLAVCKRSRLGASAAIPTRSRTS